MPELYQRASGQNLPSYGGKRVETKGQRIVDSKVVTKLQQLTQFIVGLLCTLLLFRFLLALFGANPSNAIVNGIYDFTSPFVTPFKSLFNSDIATGTVDFQIETLAAILVYILLGFVTVHLLDVFSRD